MTGGAALTGKRAVVTGAASGIGAEVARELAGAGAHVVLADRDESVRDTADDIATRLRAAAPRAAHPAQRTGRAEAQVVDLAELDAAGELGDGVDIVVNNAGWQHVAPVHQFPPDMFSAVLRVMVEAPFRIARAALPGMYAAEWGRIVNISSVHGLRASPYKSAYVTAKHGLEGLSKTIAVEGAGHGVTSNCICPGFVRTPLLQRQIAEQAVLHRVPEGQVVEDVLLEHTPIKRLVEPAEVARLALWLCGPGSASVTGSSFPMDGGWTAH